MKKYMIETRWPKPVVREIEVDRETEKYVFVSGRRIEKHTNYHIIFNTFSDAKNAFIGLMSRRVEDLEKETHRLRKMISELVCLAEADKSDKFIY